MILSVTPNHGGVTDGRQDQQRSQVLTYIHALEENPPPEREPIDWKLVTNLPVDDLSGAVEKLD